MDVPDTLLDKEKTYLFIIFLNALGEKSDFSAG
jgi:hypothetical protein